LISHVLTITAVSAGSAAGTARINAFLIADIRGYTSFTQTHGDEAAGRLAAKFAEIAREGIEAHGGELLELRGDEALAVFGSVRASLRCAAELQAVFTDETAIEPELPLTVGIGIDAGEAVPVEGGYRGGALNLAARLCSLAKAGESLASEGVIHLARAVEGLTVSEWGTAEVKGLSAPVRAFSVAGPSGSSRPLAAPGQVPADLDLNTPMLGRDAQLRRLLWSWRVARRGKGAVAVVRGPAGIGKTRLLAGLADAVARGRGACFYTAMSAPHPDLEGWWDAIVGPAVVVVDDLDAASPAELTDLAALIRSAGAQPRLLAFGLDVEHAEAAVHTAVRGWDAQLEIELPPLGMEQIRAIAELYLPGSTDAIPLEVLTGTGGVPREVHQAVSEWVAADATARLGNLAHRAASGRSDLKTLEADLAGTVIDLQRVRERARVFGSGPGRRATTEGPPYKGLASFDVEDAAGFFGRERVVAELIARLAGSALLAVVGASGSGKSSVVRAGLVPALQAGVLPGSEGWHLVVMRPGEHPMRSTERALLTSLPKSIVAALSGDRDVLGDAAAVAAEQQQQIVLVVDQFEEVFTLCEDAAERGEFIGGLVEAASAGAGVTVVITIRADYYGRCAADERLAGLLADHTVLVGPMTAEEYRRAIVNPALRVGASVELELVEALVNAVVGEPGALPLLSTTLLELWEKRSGRTLTAASYLESGGVHGAVARLAETVYAELTPQQQDQARSVLLRLAGPGEGDAVVRRRAPLTEFGAEPDTGALLRTMADRRLLTMSDGYVEVAHEALLREWPRFAGWLEEDREGIRLRAHLAAAANEWVSAGRDPAELYRGARLSAALDWTTQHSVELNDVEREFVTHSRAEAQRALSKQRRQNRRLRVSLAGVALLLVLAVVAGAVALVQRHNAQRDARVALARSLGAAAVSAPRIDEALLLARQAVLFDDSPQTEGTLLSTELRAPALIGSFSSPITLRPQHVELSPDGTTLAVIYNNSVVKFFDARTLRPLAPQEPSDTHEGVWVGSEFVGSKFFPANPYPVLHFAVMDPRAPSARVRYLPGPKVWNTTRTGANEDLFAVTGNRALFFTYNVTNPDGTVDERAWIDRIDVATGSLREVQLPGVGMVAAGQTGPNQLTVVTDNAALTLDATTLQVRNREPITLPAGVAGAVSPDGSHAAFGDPKLGNTFETIDLGSGRITPANGSHSAGILSISYTPDGKEIITTSDDGSTIVWDTGTLLPAEQFAGDNGRVLGESISTDGQTLFTCSLDGAVFEWDLGGARRLGRPFTITPHAPPSNTPGGTPPLAISPDGKQFAAGDQFGAAQLFSLADAEPIATLWNGPRAKAVATSLAWSRTGVLAGVASTGQVRMWRTQPQVQTVATASIAPDFPSGVAWSPDGTRVAVSASGPPTSSQDTGSVTIFDSSGHQLGRTVLPSAATSVAFAPDGQTVAVGRDSGDVVIVDGHTAKVERTIKLGASQGIESLAFAPSGRLLVGGWDGVVSQYDPASGRKVARDVLVAPSPVSAISVNPAADRFATTGGTSGGLTIWDAATLQQFGANFPGGLGQWGNAQYTPDGAHVIAVFDDGSGDVWPVSVPALMSHACAVARRNLTQEEWQRFVPNAGYQSTCPQFPPGP
jgi:WD40 repeat protein/class 3 adenylate cyclase